MRLIPYSFNGFIFQQNNKVASDWNIKYDWSIQGISTNAIPRSQNFPLFSAKNYAGSIKTITVNFLDVDPDKNDLVIAMDVLGENQHQLIATDEFGRAWYVNAVCLGINEEVVEGNTASFGVVFDVDDVIWKLYTPSTQTISVNGTGSGTITPLGNQPALPIITITPTGAGVDVSYKKFIAINNRSLNPISSPYPLDLTNGGLDTAALIGAGKMQVDGSDVHIFVDGVEVNRWFGGGGINSATTKIWINWTQPAKSDMTLGVAIAGAGTISTITFQDIPYNRAIMPGIPTSGLVRRNNEVFVYTGVDVANLQLTGVTRAARLTSMEAHNIGDWVMFLGHDVWMYYGVTGIPAYVDDDTNKPMIDLANSTNTSHVYADFGDDTGLRSGAWTKSRSEGDNLIVNWYYATQHAGFYTVWEALGVEVFFTIANKFWFISWDYYNPCGVTAVTATGQKMMSNATNWPTLVFISQDVNQVWSTAWTESAPGSLVTWEALDAHAAVALAATSYRLAMQAIYNSIIPANQFIYHELDAVTLTLDNTQTPTIISSAETIDFKLNSVLTNALTGDVMTLSLSMLLNTSLIVNTKEKTITMSDGTNAISALGEMPVRLEWFRLLPSQGNAISITDAGVVTFAFSWEDRSL